MRFSKAAVIFFAAVCFASAGLAQEPAPKIGNSSPERFKLQVEFQTQRAKLLKDNLELLTSLQKTELEQARAQVGLKTLEIEQTKADVQQKKANVQAAKKKLEDLMESVTYTDFDKSIIDEFEIKVKYAKASLVKANIGVELKKQEAALAELELKRLPLHGAVEINEAQLEILAAEHDLSLSNLVLQQASE